MIENTTSVALDSPIFILSPPFVCSAAPPLVNLGCSGDAFVSLTGWLWRSTKTSKYESISRSPLGQMFVSPACGYGGERWQRDQPRFHNNTEEDGVPQDREDGSCWDFSFFLRGGPIYQVEGGGGSIYHGQSLAQCSVWRPVRPLAWLTCNKPVIRWKREILWSIKNT